MGRARRSAFSFVLVILALGAATLTFARPPSSIDRTAAVGWPTSTLVVSEVATGGASASDEFIELFNAGPDTAALQGLEVVYASSTGSTVTRKASWSLPTAIGPGGHLLLANASGVFGPLADATYSGGLAATGGAVAIRVIGGSVVDAVGWGDATNAFVEMGPAPAPPAGSSLERRPGATLGNGTDTNDDTQDWFIQAMPSPQGSAAPPVAGSAAPTISPSVSGTPDASGSDAPSPAVPSSNSPSMPPASISPSVGAPTPSGEGVAPSPSATDPTPEPSLGPTPGASATASGSPGPSVPPTATADPSVSPSETEGPSAVPSATAAPTDASTPSPPVSSVPSAQPSSTAVPMTIAAARAQPDDAAVTIEGVLTTALGALEAGRTGFLQDDTAGIAIYLDVAAPDGPPAGTRLHVTGTLDDRYGQRTLRVSLADVVVLGAQALPPAPWVATGAIGEATEGARVQVSGAVTETPSALTDGLALTVDDGSGPVRVVVTPTAQGSLTVGRGSTVVVTGPAGQHDSTGSGASGYRVTATMAGELVVDPPMPSPSPDPSAGTSPPASTGPSAGSSASVSPGTSPGSSADPSASAGPVTSATPSALPTATASPGPALVPILDARSAPVGTIVRVRGTVTAEAGRLGTAALLAIADDSAGIVVRLPAGAVGPVRGTELELTGPLAAPYGQLEIRPPSGSIVVLGTGSVPQPVAIVSTELGEAVEGRLVVVDVLIDHAPHRASDGSLTLDARDAATGDRLAIRTAASSGILAGALPRDARATLTGIVGQRSSRTGRLDGYRIWLRDGADIDVTAPPAPSPTPSGAGALPTIPIAQALLTPGVALRVEGTVTAAGRLLDSNGRVIVIQDASAAIAVRLPTTARTPRVGARFRVDGTVGRAYGAPRIAATGVADLGTGAPVLPLDLRTVPGAGYEWRLVRIDGEVTSVHRAGERWTAEVSVGSHRLLVTGLPGSGIPSTALAVGRHATVLGIVRRPYPTATDRRFAIDPRSTADVRLGAPVGTSSASSSAGSGSEATTGPGGPGYLDGPGGSSTDGDALDVDLATLAEHTGATIRVGGIVTAVTAGAILLDDGTAVGRLVLAGDAAGYLDILVPGDAIDATGQVRSVAGALEVDVSRASGIVRVGDPGQDPVDPAASGALPTGADVAPARAGDGAAADRRPAAAAPGLPIGVAGAALLVAVAIAIAGLARAVRRRREDGATAGRIAARLAAFAGTGPDSSGSA